MARTALVLRSTFVLGLLTGAALAQGPASPAPDAGQTPAAPEPTQPVSAPDVVLLNNGGMLRGTISELVPNDYVVLVTATGEQRKLSMSEVKYAGPASGMPKEEPAAPTEPTPPKEPETATPKEEKTKPFAVVYSKEARIHFESDTPGVTLHRRSVMTHVASGYDELCAAPCDVSIPAGSYTLALSRGTGGPRQADDPVVVPRGDSVLHGHWHERSGTRTLGWVVMGAGIATGTYLMVTSSHDVEKCSFGTCRTESEFDTTKSLLGAAVGTIGVTVGFMLALTPDSASFTVSPGTTAALPKGTSAKLDRDTLTGLQGLTVSGRF